MQSKFFEIKLRHGYSSVNLLHICRTAFRSCFSNLLLLQLWKLSLTFKNIKHFLCSQIFIITPEYCMNRLKTEAALHGCYYKKVFWKYASNLQENTYAEVCFNKVALISRFQITLRHGSSVNFLHIFPEHLFLRIPLEGCFCKELFKLLDHFYSLFIGTKNENCLIIYSF